MVFQTVSGVVRRAKRRDLRLGQDAVDGELGFRQQGVGLRPDRRGACLVDHLLDAEIAAQLQVRPEVERIAHELRHGARVGVELLQIARAARHQRLIDAIGAHAAPLVVVARQPDACQILELPVGRDLLRRQMAVVIDDRHPLRMLVIKLLRPRSREKEVAMQKIGSGHGAEFED